MGTAIIKANKEQLESIGIDYEITNLKGQIKGYYPSGYIQVEVTHSWEGIEFTNDFDIPKYWLEIK
jgi:hypothetical protein